MKSFKGLSLPLLVLLFTISGARSDGLDIKWGDWQFGDFRYRFGHDGVGYDFLQILNPSRNSKVYVRYTVSGSTGSRIVTSEIWIKAESTSDPINLGTGKYPTLARIVELKRERDD